MAEFMAAIIAFIIVGDLANKYVEPWVNDKVESFYEEKEQSMTWVLVAAFMFNGQSTVMSDQKFYPSLDECQEAVIVRRGILDATRPEYMSNAEYWVWCTQIPQEV